MMTRKILQELQLPSVKAKGSPKMGKRENVIKETVECNSSIKSKKLNTVPNKRSKRKNVGNENKPKKTSKAVTKKAEPNACAQKEDLQKTVTLNQSRLEAYLYSSPSTSGISNNSAAENLGNITALNKSISEELQLLTSEKVSQAYWQEIAEQRRIAIEKTVIENEMLGDEISVLQTENMQLKSALDAAETLLKDAGLLD